MISPSVSRTYGALLIGGLCATFLSGVNTLQTVYYFRFYGKDSKLIKGSVGAVWILDVIHTSFIWVSLWCYLVEDFGELAKFDVIQTPELIPGAVIATSLLTLIVHMFYLKRIFYLSRKNYWIFTTIAALAICRVGAACATCAKLYRMKTWSAFGAKYKWLLSLGLIFTCATDVAIMVALIVLLQSNRQKSFTLSNVIDRLVLYSVEAGSLTACVAAATLITWYAEPHTFIFLGFYLSIAKLYANSFMGSLNARQCLHNFDDSQNSQRWQGLSRVVRSENPRRQSMEEPAVEIQLQHIQVVQYDEKPSPDV